MTDPAFFTRGEATNKDLKAYESIKRRLDRAYAEWKRSRGNSSGKANRVSRSWLRRKREISRRCARMKLAYLE